MTVPISSTYEQTAAQMEYDRQMSDFKNFPPEVSPDANIRTMPVDSGRTPMQQDTYNVTLGQYTKAKGLSSNGSGHHGAQYVQMDPSNSQNYGATANGLDEPRQILVSQSKGFPWTETGIVLLLVVVVAIILSKKK